MFKDKSGAREPGQEILVRRKVFAHIQAPVLRWVDGAMQATALVQPIFNAASAPNVVLSVDTISRDFALVQMLVVACLAMVVIPTLVLAQDRQIIRYDMRFSLGKHVTYLPMPFPT
jgi:hypothetical protein